VWYEHHPFVKAIGENPSQWRGGHWWGEWRRANRRRPLPLLLPCIPQWWESCRNRQKEPPPARGWTRGRWWWELRRNRWKEPPLARVWMWGRWWWESRRNDENDHLRLAFGCEGGGGGGSHVETTKMTTSGSHLDAREVVVVGDGSKERKKTTSGLHLDAREVVVVGDGSKCQKKPPLARVWTRGRWRWWEACWKNENDHLRLAFECKGGGGGGRHVETAKWTTSSSRFDAREMVVVGCASKWPNGPPPARVWMRGRWWWWESCQNAEINHLRLAFGHEGGGGGSRDFRCRFVLVVRSVNKWEWGDGR